MSRRRALGRPFLWEVSQDVKGVTRRSPLPALCPLGQSHVSHKVGSPEKEHSAGWAGTPCTRACLPHLSRSEVGSDWAALARTRHGRSCRPVLLPCYRSVGSSALLQPRTGGVRPSSQVIPCLHLCVGSAPAKISCKSHRRSQVHGRSPRTHLLWPRRARGARRSPGRGTALIEGGGAG